MRSNKRWMPALLLGLLAGTGWAGQKTTEVEAPLPPPALQSGDVLEPDVTIRETRREKIYEYRVNGRLVMVRVQPKVGPPYYFVDEDGDGKLEYTTDDPTQGPNVNQWVLFRWD